MVKAFPLEENAENVGNAFMHSEAERINPFPTTPYHCLRWSLFSRRSLYSVHFAIGERGSRAMPRRNSPCCLFAFRQISLLSAVSPFPHQSFALWGPHVPAPFTQRSRKAVHFASQNATINYNLPKITNKKRIVSRETFCAQSFYNILFHNGFCDNNRLCG